jgi:putative MATE family efflux protein
VLTPEDRRQIRREVFRQTWPVVLQYFFRMLMFLVDTIMIQALGKSAMASMAIVGPISYTLVMLMTALSAGAMATVARAWGGGEADRRERAVATAMLVGLGVALAILPAGWAGLPAAAQLFGTPDNPQVARVAADYLRILAWSLPLMLLDFVAGSVLRACGEARVPMVCALVGNVVNVGLNYLLIFGALGAPRMEVRGAALASAISIGLQAVLTLGTLVSSRAPVRLRWRSIRGVTRASTATLLRVTGPAFVEPVVLQSGFLVYTKVITTLGELPLAAHRSAIAVESISFMPGYAVSVAAGAVVGQYLGAGRPDKASAGFVESMKIGLGLLLINALLFLTVPHVLLWPFEPKDLPAGMAAGLLRIAAMEQPFMAMALVLAGAMRGAGDTRSPVWLGAAGTWGVRVPCAYLLAIGLGLGLTGIWITMVLDWAARSLLSWIVWRRGAWKQIRL